MNGLLQVVTLLYPRCPTPGLGGSLPTSEGLEAFFAALLRSDLQAEERDAGPAGAGGELPGGCRCARRCRRLMTTRALVQPHLAAAGHQPTLGATTAEPQRLNSINVPARASCMVPLGQSAPCWRWRGKVPPNFPPHAPGRFRAVSVRLM